jgi:beta-phosphoglucomutase
VTVRALLIDFNGTLSDDEPVLCDLWGEIFAEHGRPLAADRYYDELAGLSDPEIAARWLGENHPALGQVLEERVRRYRRRVGDGSTVSAGMRGAVRYAAERVPVAVVSGAARADVELVLAAAGLADAVTVVISAEDVARGKPDPEGYAAALARLLVSPEDAVALEDSEAGVAAAKAAGAYVVAVLGTMPRERLARADEIAERVDLDLIRNLLS